MLTESLTHKSPFLCLADVLYRYLLKLATG